MKKTDKNAKRGKITWLFLFILLAVAAGGFFYFKNQSKETANPFQGMAIVETITDNISIKAKGSGSVEPAVKRTVSLEYGGKLASIYVEAGDQIHTGDVLARYDVKSLDSLIKTKETELATLNQTIDRDFQNGSYSGDTYVTAPITGNVKRVFASAGDSTQEVIQKYGGVIEIASDNKLKVEFTVEGEAPEQGTLVKVVFGQEQATGIIESSVGTKICVTIPDKLYYKVGTQATVYTKNGQKLGSGVLETNLPYLVQAENGVISYLNVTPGMKVYAGGSLFSYSGAVYSRKYVNLITDRDEHLKEIKKLTEYRDNPVVVSEFDGYVVSVDAVEGTSYKEDQRLCVIADSSALNLKVEIDELDIDGVRIGMKADVIFDAFADQVYEGTVEKISGIGKNAGGVTTYKVTISLPGDSHIRDAMRATAEIILKNSEQAVLVPEDAVIAEGDKNFVLVVHGTDLIKTEVQIGLVNEDYVEIVNGLSAGTEVAFKKIIQSESFMDSLIYSGPLSFLTWEG